MTSTVRGRIADLVEKNKKFSETWKNPVEMVQMRELGLKSRAATIVLTCLDPRSVPEQFLGPNYFGGCIRNAGGRATEDVVRSILVLRSLVDIQAVLVIHHTDCGMSHLTDKGITTDVHERTPEAAAEIDGLTNSKLSFGCFTAGEFEDKIREDVKTLRAHKSLKGVEIIGFALDTQTGLIKELDI